MLDRFEWGRKLARASRLFFFKNDVLRSSHLRGDNKTISRLYDFFAPVYDFLFPRFRSFQDTANHVVTTLVQPGDQVLDLGAGTGFLTMKIAPKVQSVVAMDLNGDMLKRARKKAQKSPFGTNIMINQGSATQLPFKDESFTLVTSSFMEVYLSVPDKVLMLNEIHRVLAPGGRLIFLTGNGEISGRYIKRTQWEEILSQTQFADLEFTELYDVFRVIFGRKAFRGTPAA